MEVSTGHGRALTHRLPCADTSSAAFQQIVAPFSQRIAELDLAKVKVPGCSAVNSASAVSRLLL